MPELRYDFLTGCWVAVSEERSNRPEYESIMQKETPCPFCPENERLLPPLTYKSQGGTVRAAPNKYPALSPADVNGYGYHEVLIDTPVHDEKLYMFTDEHMLSVFLAIQNRMINISADRKIKYIEVFKNDGVKAGASIPHSHWQLIAMPIVPPVQETIYKNARDFFYESGRCFLCDEAVGRRELIVCENDGAVAFVPYASRFSFGVNVVPRKHFSDFRDIDSAVLMDMCRVMKKALAALCDLLPGLSYNICFQNAPETALRMDEAVHFYIEIIPRLSSLAGFELGTGCYINTCSPENTARLLKEAIGGLNDD